MTIADALWAVAKRLSRVRSEALESWASAWILRYGTVPEVCTDNHNVTWLRDGGGGVPDWVSEQKLRDAAERLPIGISAHPGKYQLAMRTNGTAIGHHWEPLSEERRALHSSSGTHGASEGPHEPTD